MRASRLLRSVGTALVAAVVALAPAQADPFFEDMTLQSRAYGLELVGVRLALVEAFDPVPAALEEPLEGLFEHDLPRFLGTLEARDPIAAAELVQALGKVVEGVEEGNVGPLDLAYAKAWTARAYDVVVPVDQRTPAFWGAVVADLLLGEPGVAEALEEALEEDEPWEFPIGWAALQRVEALWSELAPLASAEEASFARQYLDILGSIYASPAPPAVLPANPEEAEAPAQSLVGVLESVLDASLYTGRDFGRLASALVDETAIACRAYAQGEDAIAAETVFAVGTQFEANLVDLLELFDPGIAEGVDGMLAVLLGLDEGDDGDADRSMAGGGEDDDDLADPAAACMELMEALEEARALLGG